VPACPPPRSPRPAPPGRRRRGDPARAAALALLALAGSPLAARGDGLTLRYTPAFTLVDSESTLADGTSTDSRLETLAQRLTLGLDRRLTPTISAGASGLLDWNRSWNRDEAGHLDQDQYRWLGTARLEYLADPLRGALLYSRRDARVDTTRAGTTVRLGGPTIDDYSASLSWRPADLPTASLSLTRTDARQAGSSPLDRTTSNASLALGWDGWERWRLGYAWQLLNPVDRVRSTESVDQVHTARVAWNDTFAGDRGTSFASYTLTGRSSRTTSGALGATRETRQLPSAGLAAVERFPDTAERITLPAVPALVDADLAGSAGIDLGHARSAGGDVAPRDLGLRLPDDRTDVNTLRVHVDRQLPPAVSAAFSWEVWRSDDNLAWARVATVPSAPFGDLQNRFEISFPTIRARYLKVVTRPLAVAASTDPAYAAILVTELEAWLVEALPPGTVRSGGLAGSAMGGLRLLLLKDPSVVYDLVVNLNHRSHPGEARGTMEHSLAWAQELDPHTRASARLVRSDSFEPGAHRGQTGWGAALTGDPLPTLGWTANYSGSHAASAAGTALTNGVAASARADLYERASLGVNAAARLARAESGRRTRQASAGLSATASPHAALSLTGTLGWLHSSAWGGGLSEVSGRAGRVEGTATFNPFPALYLSASGSRNLFGLDPAVQTGLGAGVSLLHGGGLSLRFNFNRTSDTLSGIRSRSLGSGLVWTLAPGKSLSANFTRLDSTTPSEVVRSDAFTVLLQLPAL